MKQPSKEALEMALKLYKRPSEQPGNIAAVLDDLKCAAERAEARAEAAEKRSAELVELNIQYLERERFAEARLADCVREVRDWASQHEIGEVFESFEDDHLDAILAKYEAKPGIEKFVIYDEVCDFDEATFNRIREILNRPR